VISAIDGTAGIGKTTLAVHWARRVQDWFPDGQLYVNLRGFDPTGTPMRTADAIRGFLDAFEIPAERIPSGLDAQAALYRTLIADRRVLVLLDNARDVDQVRPLLPGGPNCFVVITTRVQMPGLVTGQGARPLTLGALGRSEAESLVAQHLGQGRLLAEAQAVGDLVANCGGLPLALSIVAARAQRAPPSASPPSGGRCRPRAGRPRAAAHRRTRPRCRGRVRRRTDVPAGR
jgi:predicted ATPase